MDLENLEQLEFQIERLLALHEKVKEEKAQAETRLRQKENEFATLKGQILRYEHERRELRARLDKIIGQFERLDLS
jgi:septal ring factor EnvC (AmiA/AmiB activator)